MIGKDKKEDPKQNITYLIGDFSKATVKVANGVFGMMKTSDPGNFQKPVHDESLKDQIFRFWNAEQKFHGELAKRPNAFVFAGDLSGQVFEIDQSGIAVQSIPELER